MDRRTIEALLEKGRTGEAIALLRTWLEQEPSSSRARAGLSILESVSTEHPRHFVDVRLGLLSTFTIEPLAAHLRLWGFLNRLRIDVHCAPFSQIESQLLDGGSELWRFDPEVIAIACDGADLAAPLYERYLHLAASDGVEPLVVEALARTRGWMEAVRERSSAPVLIHGFVPPIHPSLGCMDTSVRPGQIDTVHRMNASSPIRRERLARCT